MSGLEQSPVERSPRFATVADRQRLAVDSSRGVPGCWETGVPRGRRHRASDGAISMGGWTSPAPPSARLFRGPAASPRGWPCTVQRRLRRCLRCAGDRPRCRRGAHAKPAWTCAADASWPCVGRGETKTTALCARNVSRRLELAMDEDRDDGREAWGIDKVWAAAGGGGRGLSRRAQQRNGIRVLAAFPSLLPPPPRLSVLQFSPTAGLCLVYLV